MTIKKNIKHIYNTYAHAFDQKIAGLTLYHASYDALLESVRDGASVLDLGCGPGNVSAYLKNNRPALKITGVDIAGEMIAIARHRIPDGSFHVGDIVHIDFLEEFDCVICAFAIPYLSLEETGRVAQQIHTGLKHNGVYYISFLEGLQAGLEKTSFSGDDALYMYYHPKQAIYHLLIQNGLWVRRQFLVDYPEMDGSTTREIVYIGTKSA
ncbi:MAG: class I SAM-dependent methyltransferase [Desulfobacteraceae bacterium]|jgi:SAM-dependent methyltransferase